MSKKNTTLKFLIFILIFMIVVFAFVLLFVIPSIKDYKDSKLSYSNSQNLQTELQKEQEELISTLNIIKNKNKNIINTFSQEFKENEFISFTKKYFNDATLVKVHNESNSSALDIYKFNAKIKAKNPKQFYEFVKNLQNYNGIIKINFPITISSKDNFLEINFHMSVYSMKVN